MTDWHIRLKEIREKYNYSQDVLAELLGVDFSAISRYESGRGAKKLSANFRLKLKPIFTNDEIEYIEQGGTELQLKAMFADLGKKENVIGNTTNSSNITQNSHNNSQGTLLSHEEETLIKYFRKRDEEIQEKILAFALTGKCD